MTAAKGVPRRGPTTPVWVAKLIGEIFLELTRDQGHEPFANDVYVKLKEALKEQDHLPDLPSLRKVQEVLQHARERLRTRSVDQRLLDAPWSLGALARYGVLVDVAGELVEIWRLCLAAGQSFSVREALWVVRLRSTMPSVAEFPWHPVERLNRLYAWASIYALRERATEILGIPEWDTRDLDATLVRMHYWEWLTAIRLGAIAPSWHSEGEEPRLRRIRAAEHEIESASGREAPLLGGLPHEAVESRLGGLSGWEKSRRAISGQSWVLDMIQPSPVASSIYAYWLRHLANGPKWSGIPFGRRQQIAVRLREEVQAVEQATDQYIGRWGGWLTTKDWGEHAAFAAPGSSIGPEPGPVPSEASGQYHSPPFMAWEPRDLLKEVGYGED